MYPHDEVLVTLSDQIKEIVQNKGKSFDIIFNTNFPIKALFAKFGSTEVVIGRINVIARKHLYDMHGRDASNLHRIMSAVNADVNQIRLVVNDWPVGEAL